MTSESCPPLEDLLRFLEEQADPVRLAEIGTHVDICHRCQEMLEELTRGHACGLSVLSRDLLGGTPGCDPRGPGPKFEPEEVPESTQGRRNPSMEPESIAALDGDSAGHGDRTAPPCDPDASTVDYVPLDSDRTTDGPLPRAFQDSSGEESSNRWPRILSYEILEVIREGGMGVVYKAQQRGLNRLVALKMIRGGERACPDHFARFRIEAEAVARLRHPNIVQIYEIGEAEGLPFLSLELLGGGTLADRLASTPQPVRQAAELMITLARAVQVAHDANIVHRDLKPSNVLFTEDGIPKITDFGLAKRLETDSHQTESGQIMGSPSYMAPEQARGHAKDVGPAADVYALGAMLYEMLTGRPPFKGKRPLRRSAR
jgi:hypothetical protein